MTAAMEDLAAWLTAVWDEEERLATYALGRPWLKTKLYPDEPWHFLPLYQPELALARIAADRKILELHTYSIDGGWVDCANCGEVGNETEGVTECLHRRLLAEPFADRPGFRSEWLIERQGVEGAPATTLADTGNFIVRVPKEES